jgi:hypothetical protein
MALVGYRSKCISASTQTAPAESIAIEKSGAVNNPANVNPNVNVKGGSGSNKKLDLDDASDRLGHTRMDYAARSRVSIKNAETVNNPLVSLSGSTPGEGEDKIVATPSKQEKTFWSKIQKRWF